MWESWIGPYEVSDSGEIRNGRTGRLVAQKIDKRWGHHYVNIYVEKKHITRYVHRAVLEAFVGQRPEGLQARHLNDVKSDNRLSNLVWGTPKENGEDSVRNGRTPRGQMVSGAKLTEDQVREILISDATEETLAERYGVNRSSIGLIRRRKNWAWVTV